MPQLSVTKLACTLAWSNITIQAAPLNLNKEVRRILNSLDYLHKNNRKFLVQLQATHKVRQEQPLFFPRGREMKHI
jgi:hypothetical protein